MTMSRKQSELSLVFIEKSLRFSVTESLNIKTVLINGENYNSDFMEESRNSPSFKTRLD